MISYLPCYILTVSFRDRPDTIRCIVASLVGDGESGDSLVDDSEPVQPLAQVQTEDYSDPNWEPEPMDAGPGMFYDSFSFLSYQELTKRGVTQISERISLETLSVHSSASTTPKIYL